MHLRQSVLGEVAIRSDQTLSGVDVGTLVRRLILFDRVIVKSFRLREMPTLIRAFGKSGFGDLINLGLLQFTCEFTTLAVDMSLNGVRHVPLEHFSLGIVNAANREADLRSELVALQGVTGLKNSERSSIEETIWRSLVRPPDSWGKDLLAQVDSDLRSNAPILRFALVERLKQELAPEMPTSQIEIKAEEVRERVFYIKNNLAAKFGFSSEKTHALLQAAVTAAANLDHRLAEMLAYTAITGFLDSEAPLLFGKLSGVVAPLNPELSEKQFERVIELAGVPDFKPGQRIDVQKLLKVRDSEECREFREWLCTLEDVSDTEIREMVEGIKATMASLANSVSGKLVRLATTTGVGMIPVVGPITGAIAGAVDSFLVDKVLPRSGIVAFLTEKYPSLFVSP
jgi:hypothetical protein